jgi:hypothetical protein
VSGTQIWIGRRPWARKRFRCALTFWREVTAFRFRDLRDLGADGIAPLVTCNLPVPQAGGSTPFPPTALRLRTCRSGVCLTPGALLTLPADPDIARTVPVAERVGVGQWPPRRGVTPLRALCSRHGRSGDFDLALLASDL